MSYSNFKSLLEVMFDFGTAFDMHANLKCILLISNYFWNRCAITRLLVTYYTAKGVINIQAKLRLF